MLPRTLSTRWKDNPQNEKIYANPVSDQGSSLEDVGNLMTKGQVSTHKGSQQTFISPQKTRE